MISIIAYYGIDNEVLPILDSLRYILNEYFNTAGYRGYSGDDSLLIILRIFLYYEWIRYRAIYSDIKEQTTYSFDTYIC